VIVAAAGKDPKKDDGDDSPQPFYTPEQIQTFTQQTEGTFKPADELDEEEKKIYPGGIGI